MEMGLTMEEVADSLRLGVDVIKDLEAGDYAGLPGPTFVKGYMRSYARLLHLDGDDLVGRIELEPEPAPIAGIESGKEVPRRRIRFRTRRRRSRSPILRWLMVLLVLGGLVAGGLALLPWFGFNRISDLVPIDQIASRWFTPGDLAGNPGERDSGDSAGQSTGALIRLE